MIPLKPKSNCSLGFRVSILEVFCAVEGALAAPRDRIYEPCTAPIESRGPAQVTKVPGP